MSLPHDWRLHRGWYHLHCLKDQRAPHKRCLAMRKKKKKHYTRLEIQIWRVVAIFYTCSLGWTSSNWIVPSAKKSSSISVLKIALYIVLHKIHCNHYTSHLLSNRYHAVTWFVGSVSLVDIYTSMKTVITSPGSTTLSWVFKIFCPKLIMMPYKIVQLLKLNICTVPVEVITWYSLMYCTKRTISVNMTADELLNVSPSDKVKLLMDSPTCRISPRVTLTV